MAFRSYTDAAHDLRMTVHLLKWFTSYAVKDRKLETLGGSFDPAALAEFDAHLKCPWPTKDVPAGIGEELLREARGHCPLCSDPAPRLEQAHIERYGVELKHHCQHPHNLILLCPTCHSRYDAQDKTITLVVVKHAKEQQLSRSLESAERDYQLAQIGKNLFNALSPIFNDQHALPPEARTQLGAFLGQVHNAVSAAPDTSPSSSGLVDTLRKTAEIVSLTMPVTGSVLSAYSGVFSQPAEERIAPSEEELWENIDHQAEPGECDQCGCPTAIESYSCNDCESGCDEYVGEDGAYQKEDGNWYISRTDFRMRYSTEYPIKCEHCGSRNLEIEFESYCGGCKHMMERAQDD